MGQWTIPYVSSKIEDRRKIDDELENKVNEIWERVISYLHIEIHVNHSAATLKGSGTSYLPMRFTGGVIQFHLESVLLADIDATGD